MISAHEVMSIFVTQVSIVNIWCYCNIYIYIYIIIMIHLAYWVGVRSSTYHGRGWWTLVSGVTFVGWLRRRTARFSVRAAFVATFTTLLFQPERYNINIYKHILFILLKLYIYLYKILLNNNYRQIVKLILRDVQKLIVIKL